MNLFDTEDLVCSDFRAWRYVSRYMLWPYTSVPPRFVCPSQSINTLSYNRHLS